METEYLLGKKKKKDLQSTDYSVRAPSSPILKPWQLQSWVDWPYIQAHRSWNTKATEEQEMTMCCQERQGMLEYATAHLVVVTI